MAGAKGRAVQHGHKRFLNKHISMNSGAGGSGRPTATANAPHAGAAGPNAAAMHRGKSAGPRTSEGLAQRRTARIAGSAARTSGGRPVRRRLPLPNRG